jgi:outer membrane protein OmpU
MRSLLVAGATVAAAGALSPAAAQTNPMPEMNLPPVSTQGIVARPGALQTANDSNDMAAVPSHSGVVNPVPGSVVVRINARVVYYLAAESSSLDKTAGTGPANTGAAKLGPDMTLGFMRLYFGMDGMATNGLRYGGAIEIRQNFGAAAGSTSSTDSSAISTGSTLYVRRAFGYVAGDRWGIFRFGQGDSPLGILDNGVTTFQNFDDTAWNGPNINQAIPTNAQPTFPFLSLTGSDYGSSKLVYLTPQFSGFDFGVSWAPNNAALQDANCSTASSGCYNLTSSSATADATRYVNMYVAGARYQGTFGPVGVYGMAAYYGSGRVNYTGSTPGNQFNGLSVGDFGLALTYAGVTIGGHDTFGRTNGQGALQPSGGVHANAWLAGVQYSTGPFIIGTSFFNYQSQGSPSLVGISQRNENGLDVGLTLSIAPGLGIWAQYLYGNRHQGGFDFQTSAAGSAFNNVKSQAIGIGPFIRW